MRLPKIIFPSRVISTHGSEIVLLGLIAGGVILVLFKGIMEGHMLDVAAFLLVLQRIIEAIQKRWEQRGVDRLGEMVGQSQPLGGTVQIDQPEDDPIPTKEIKK